MSSPPARRTLSAVVAATALVLGTAACGSDVGSGSAPAGGSVVTSFYPLQFATQQITGGKLPVTVLTKPGAEPHDLELAPQDIGGMTKARLVVYSDGFQPAVDEAVGLVDASKVLDVADVAKLVPAAADGADHEAESAESGESGESADTSAGHDEHDHGADDPHFWLDPSRYAAVAQAISARLSKDDPANAATYAKNTAQFVEKLSALDDEMRVGLRQCRIKELVTSHAAFGYLASRYGFQQRGITGVSPEAEPSAAALKAVGDLVRSTGVTTIYQETLVEPHFAQTVASSTGAEVKTLDPIEGITTESAGADYFEVMRSNLATLRVGQECS
ncbi:zinc ABC transporter substrate-binding protein [Terrabacter tumescens]|uniref:Zinc ABC transporter substrate-binding protein n=1 Tax=Terrabacter tumescens TaxID=60443 RepID=A0ABQ2HIH0_9MICO|nr:metal ABC transporter substrate-binding protein [Terrabacter tumescens]GGM81681.1 zinc ABC transporter substrate-binding protein [Terrabacter tumescens]